MGKSELILRFLGDKPALYYLGKKAPASLQIREFLKVASTVLEEPLLATYPADHWGDALDAVMERRPAGRRIALAFDEFQWTVEASPELPSLLQERWDRYWQHSDDVFLVLCGSYVGFMEREVLGRKSPLFGRRTAVLLAVASGQSSARDVSRVTGIGSGSLPYYLKQLIELGYLARRHPLTGKAPNPRDVRYDLGDPLLRFWFRFVFPDQSRLRRLGPERALAEILQPRLDAYFGLCFERLCREALPRLYEREGVTAAFEVGEYWSKTTQVDVVGLRADGWTDLGECKWGTVRSAPDVERELEEKVKLYPNRRHATLGRRVFTRLAKAPRRKESSGVRWHSLEELYD